MAEDWYRLPDWDEPARADFERRLGRARAYNRSQYLRIKGLALLEAGEADGARSLWRRVIERDAGADQVTIDAGSAMEHLADSYAAEDPATALELYERSLEGLRLGRGTTGMQQVKMAELLLQDPGPDDLDRAADLLTAWVEEAHLPFPTAHFRWNLALVDLSLRAGDETTAREAARRALDLADRGPVFSRHPTVGVVDADPATLERLRALSG